jgi:hypothetical protein
MKCQLSSASRGRLALGCWSVNCYWMLIFRTEQFLESQALPARASRCNNYLCLYFRRLASLPTGQKRFDWHASMRKDTLEHGTTGRASARLLCI